MLAKPISQAALNNRKNEMDEMQIRHPRCGRLAIEYTFSLNTKRSNVFITCSLNALNYHMLDLLSSFPSPFGLPECNS